MSVRIRYKIEAAVSSSSSEEKDLGNLSFEVLSDAAGEGGVRKTLLAVGAADVSVGLNEIATATFILIRTNPHDQNDTPATIQIKKNGVGGEVTEVVPLNGSKNGHMLLSTSGITALYASNPGTVDMEITVMAVGD